MDRRAQPLLRRRWRKGTHPLNWIAQRVALAALAGLTTVAVACSGGGDAAAPTVDETYAPAVLAEGKSIYDQTCAACHGRNGGGGIGPELRSVAGRLTFEEHVEVIQRGRGSMPAFGATLTTGQIEAVAAYERVWTP